MSDHVRVEGLRITFRDDAGREAAAVEGADLRLGRGETLGIVGESGSGKSTLARALLGYARPGARFAAGRVLVGDTDVLALGPAQIRAFRGRRAAMVPQNPLSSLTPHMRVGDLLAELVRLHTGLRGAAVMAQVHALMDSTGLPDPATLARRYPHEISGGQRQRAVIAGALIGSPELIVLDEPTTALDKTVEARVLALVQEVQERLGATLVYVSHDLNVIRRVCARVAVMRDGAIVEAGPTDEVLGRPRSAYARGLVAAIPRIDVAGPPPVVAHGAEGLRLEGLSFAYARPRRLFGAGPAATPALDGINLVVPRGETLGIVGESGSGKSTLAAVIAGVMAGHQGRILLGGAVVSGPARARSTALRRRIQLVFQDPLSALNPTQTVAEILARPLRLYRGLTAAAARAEARALMDEMGLAAILLDRRPRQLSGGQQQRVGLARALAADPELLICDEVTSALDVTIQAQVLDLFQRLQRERGLTCLFISHDLGVVARVSHRIAVLEGGQLRETGARDAVLHAPRHAYTRRLLAANPPAEGPAILLPVA
ncbi:ABC transporter ATP-binding protein [Pararhodobacter sp.]|uniref:ABC transporter ATP-binding protein n=1 Tax=Pararhodobacter sp. TaxID=2127056 RepID=UPI002FDC7F11